MCKYILKMSQKHLVELLGETKDNKTRLNSLADLREKFSKMSKQELMDKLINTTTNSPKLPKSWRIARGLSTMLSKLFVNLLRNDTSSGMFCGALDTKNVKHAALGRRKTSLRQNFKLFEFEILKSIFLNWCGVFIENGGCYSV